MLMMTSVSLTSCSNCYDDDEDVTDRVGDDVSLRMYNTYVLGAWVLINEEGYADFDEDGLKEFFDEEIYKNERYSTVLVMKSDKTCEMVPYERGRYVFEHSKKCNYSISMNYLHIYNNRDYDRTYRIEVFKENIMKLMFTDKGSCVTFTFKYLYDDLTYELNKDNYWHGHK